jgi:hypothetical protein
MLLIIALQCDLAVRLQYIKLLIRCKLFALLLIVESRAQ